MADSASAILLVRLQSTGSNNNLWGGYLNDNQEILERGNKGYQAYTVTGDATISQTNYSKTNDYAIGAIKLNGAPSASWTHTLPARQNLFFAWNNSGQTGTLKTSGGTGVSLATTQRACIFGDGTDYYNAAPTLFPTADVTFAGKLRGVTAGTLSTDAVNKTQMETAIAAAAGLTAPFILVSATDTTAGYLGQKIVGTGAASVSVINTGADEDVQISVGALGLTDGGTQASGFTAASNTRYNCVFGAAGTITLPASPTAKDVIVLHLAGYYVYTLNPNGLKINTSTANLPLIGNQTVVLEYSGATNGWV